MKAFRCVATDAKGRKYSGTFEAGDEEEARRMLSSEGYRIVSLVEVEHGRRVRLPRSWGDLEALRHRSIENQAHYAAESRAPSPAKIRTEILSYLMPLGAILIALAGIPLTLALLGPKGGGTSRAAVPPSEIVEEYFALETLEAYEEQFVLLTAERRSRFEDAAAYQRQRRLRAQADAMTGAVFSAGKISGITVERESAREAEVTARLFRDKGLVRLRVVLEKEKGKWRVDSVLDPEWLKAQAGRVAGETDAGRREELLDGIKRESGLADLAIREAVEAVLARKREEEKKKTLGENYFDIFDVS